MNPVKRIFTYVFRPNHRATKPRVEQWVYCCECGDPIDSTHGLPFRCPHCGFCLEGQDLQLCEEE